MASTIAVTGWFSAKARTTGGSGSEFSVRRPADTATRVHLKGWGSGVVFDDQMASGDVRLQNPNYEGAARRYDLEVSGTGSMIPVAAG